MQILKEAYPFYQGKTIPFSVFQNFEVLEQWLLSIFGSELFQTGNWRIFS
jgi:hypothetical protein